MFRTMAVLVLLIVATPGWAGPNMHVATTLPDLADWVVQLGGDRVEVRSLLHGAEDPHTYEPRVSDVKILAGSRVLVKVGLGLEEWLDGLIENANNSELMVVDAGAGLAVVSDPGSHGHGGHSAGNPHVWLDPANAVIMCERIAHQLEVADPAAGALYAERLQVYRGRLREAAAAIRARVAKLPDRRFISYHPAWPYFARAFDLEVVDVVTPVPGQEPPPKRIKDLIQAIRKGAIRVLVTEPQLPSEIPALLRDETGIQVVTLSPLLGSGAATDYLGQLRSNADILLRALGEPP